MEKHGMVEFGKRAHSLTVLIDYSRVSKSKQYDQVIARTYALLRTSMPDF